MTDRQKELLKARKKRWYEKHKQEMIYLTKSQHSKLHYYSGHSLPDEE